MSWLPVAAAVVSIAGNVQAGNAAKRAAIQQQAEAQYAAEQMRVNAGQALAAAELAAQEERRQGELVQSRAIALIAAQGGSMTDPSAVALLSRNAGETAYRSAVAIYKGQEEARQMEAGAIASVTSGNAAAQTGRDMAKAYSTRAFGDLLNGGNSLYNKYGLGGVQPEQAPAPVTTATPRVIG